MGRTAATSEFLAPEKIITCSICFLARSSHRQQQTQRQQRACWASALFRAQPVPLSDGARRRRSLFRALKAECLRRRMAEGSSTSAYLHKFSPIHLPGFPKTTDHCCTWHGQQAAPASERPLFTCKSASDPRAHLSRCRTMERGKN